MKTFGNTAWPALASLLAITVICGMAYTGLVTVFAQLAFREKANGSLVMAKSADGSERVVGSELIAQEFAKPEYLAGRPMGATNLSPTGTKERELVAQRVADWQARKGEARTAIPVDIVTASGSGVDPFISPEAAEYQIAGIARARGIDETAVRAAIAKNTNGRFLGVFGQPAVNVLKVNLTLDALP
jgi:K+-transporting ATPase ATPase C chain